MCMCTYLVSSQHSYRYKVVNESHIFAASITTSLGDTATQMAYPRSHNEIGFLGNLQASDKKLPPTPQSTANSTTVACPFATWIRRTFSSAVMA